MTAVKNPAFRTVVLLLFVATCAQPALADDEKQPASAGKSSYLKSIKPLLRDKCFACHSARKQEGGLRLDAASLIRKGGDSGPALIEKSAAKSLILERVTADDDGRMPPADEGSRLTAEEIAKLTAWIEAGALAPDEAIPSAPSQHWAFQPPVKGNVPPVDAKWVHSDIDRFLAAEHRRTGVTAVGETSRSMLLRRASLALTGLPPTPEERRAFLNDKSQAAFEDAVDRLLASPRYGERWARHFMDIWRYSDPSGYGKEIRDGREHIWRWRDWIVESLNEDKGYDRMVIEMLAADEVSPEDQSTLRATGFLARNWYKFNRNVWLDNIVEHSSKAFLGLTINCARCHAHKYDPFEQQSYYRMRAIFETHDLRDDPLTPASLSTKTGTLVRSYDAHLDRKTFRFFQGNENRPDESTALPPGLPELLGELSIEPVSLPVTAWYPALAENNHLAADKMAQAAIAKASQEVQAAEAALGVATRKLKEFQEPESKTLPPPPAKPVAEKPVLTEDFSQLDLDRWSVESGQWSAKDGRVLQSNGATAQHRLISKTKHPRNFRAKLRLRITGGETYRSVGLGFDVNGKAMNAVYLSVSGPKVQFTHQGSDGRWVYPAAGMTTTPVKVGQDYVLELAAKDYLLNVLIDGELKVAYKLPARKAGQISVWAFSATAEFDQLDVTELPPQTHLKAASGGAAPPKTLTKTDLEHQVKLSKVKLALAKARLRTARSAAASLDARRNAEATKYGLGEGDLVKLARDAGWAHRQHMFDLKTELALLASLKQIQAEYKVAGAAPTARGKAEGELKAAQKELANAEKALATAKAQLEKDSGEYPALGPQYPKTSSGRRIAFARWVTDRKNPLAARVLVNHVWLRHFDQPLVERTFDFGLRSEEPRHAELLDWLAVQFMEDGWSLKKLHKRILIAGIYRLSSSSAGSSAATLAADPDNRTLWRMNTRRMEAEVVRDSVLALGGSLDLTTGGPPIEHTQGQAVLRRSLYFRQDKERQMTFLSLFDGAKVSECYERKSTVAPQQALALFNSRIAAGQARKIADVYSKRNGSEFVTALFEHVLCREPSAKELSECTTFLAEFKESAEARRQLALVLLNHNDFVTIR